MKYFSKSFDKQLVEFTYIAPTGMKDQLCCISSICNPCTTENTVLRNECDAIPGMYACFLTLFKMPTECKEQREKGKNSEVN